MNHPVGCAPSPYFNPAVAGYPMSYPAGASTAPTFAPFYAGTSIIGADAPAEQGFTDKAKAWLNEPTLGVQNKYLVGGAVVIAGTWYAYHEGWFGK